MEAGKRHIKSGIGYSRYFDSSKGATINLPKSDVYDTLAFMEELVGNTIAQTKQITTVLKGDSLNDTCRNIFDFLYNHIQYEPDKRGIEQLRTPNRAWADREKGIDCDCYSIFISSILTNLSIPHGFRITKYDGKSNYQHVYVIVPKDGKTASVRDSYYVIDPVLNGYNQEKPFSAKHDKMMKIPHQILNGVHDAPTSYSFGNEYNNLSGLGSTEDNFLASTKAHLENTLTQLNRNPKAFTSVIDPAVFKEQLIYVLENWNNPVARNGALEEMAEMEDLAENASLTGVGFIRPTSMMVRKPQLSPKGAIQKVQLLRKRREVQPSVIPATINRGTLQKDKSFNTNCFCHMVNGLEGYYSTSLQGLNGLDGFFKRVWSGVKKTATKVSSGVKTVAKKVGETAKKIGQGIVRYNPLTIAARNGLLLVMKLNLFGLAKKLKYGYLTEQQARAKNMNILEWRKVKDTINRMDKLFINIGGKPDNLKKSILTGKAGGLNGLGAVATASAVTASTGLVATITAWIKKIDFNKLFNTAKTVVNKTKQIQTIFRPTTNVMRSVPVSQSTFPTEESIVPSITLPEMVVTADRVPSKPKSNKGLLIGLAVAGVAGAILLAKSKKKGLAGVVESVAL